MTRGTLFYYESDNKVWESTEFNGDMYHGTAKEPEGIGDDVIKLMTGLKSLDDFKTVLREINKHYEYKEGNDCWACGKAAVTKNINRTIKWIDEERTDLKGDSHMDPRECKSRPTFRDTNTWHFWGVPNLSDYSYIYNNSGKDLVMKTCDDGEMIIPDGYLGVLHYGSNDCLCKDGKIVDGMGHYKEDVRKSKKRKYYKVEFEMEYTGDEDKIKRVIDHHIEELIDFDEWSEIKGIYNAEITEVKDA